MPSRSPLQRVVEAVRCGFRRRKLVPMLVNGRHGPVVELVSLHPNRRCTHMRFEFQIDIWKMLELSLWKTGTSTVTGDTDSGNRSGTATSNIIHDDSDGDDHRR